MDKISEKLFYLLKFYFMYTIISHFGLLNGLYICIVSFYSYKKLLSLILNKELLSPSDMIFIGNSQKDRFNICCYLNFENFNVDEMKQYLIERMFKETKKLRMKICFRFAHYFWEETDITEALSTIKTVHLKSKEQLTNYYQQEINSYIDIHNKHPYEIHLITYEGTKGTMLFKFDHMLSDGLGMVQLIVSLASNYDPSMFPKIMQISRKWYEPLLDILTLPLNAPYAAYQMILAKNDSTPFRASNFSRSDQTKFSISQKYDMKTFDSIRKKYNLTFNDFILSVVTMSVKRMISKTEFNKVNWIKFLAPVGKKKIPNSIKDVKLNNEAEGALIDLKLMDDISKAKEISNRIKKYLKSTGLSSAYIHLLGLLNELLPSDVFNYFISFLTRNIDISASNVPISFKELKYGNAVLKSIVPIVSPGKGVTFIPIISYNGHFRLSISTDVNNINIKPDEFIKTVQEILDENVNIKEE